MTDLTPEQAENLNPVLFKVLFVEDSLDVTEFIREQIEGREGMNVSFTENGEDAIELLEKEKELGKPFDLIITDWHLPGKKDGFAVAKRIKEKSLARQVFMLSASAEDLRFISEEELRSLGIDRVLSKKSDIGHLPGIIRDERERQIAAKTQS